MKPIEISPGVFQISGKYVLVDPEDAHLLRDRCWHINYGYVKRNRWKHEGKGMVLLHREIMRPPEGMFVDHINLNRCDCRKSNMRICNQAQNMANRPKFKNSVWPKGVTLERSGRWKALIYKEKEIHRLGLYDTPEEAHAAYVKAAAELHGEFARLA